MIKSNTCLFSYRYIAICKPMMFVSISTCKRAVCCLLFIAFLSTIPVSLFTKPLPKDRGVIFCTFSYESLSTYIYHGLLLAAFTLCTVCVFILYSLIYARFCQQFRKITVPTFTVINGTGLYNNNIALLKKHWSAYCKIIFGLGRFME